MATNYGDDDDYTDSKNKVASSPSTSSPSSKSIDDDDESDEEFTVTKRSALSRKIIESSSLGGKSKNIKNKKSNQKSVDDIKNNPMDVIVRF